MTKKLSDFRLATAEEIEKARKAADELVGHSLFPGLTKDVHKSVIYKVMAETFGQPNYHTYFHPLEKGSWEWIIFSNIGLLSVYDYYGDWSIGCSEFAFF